MSPGVSLHHKDIQELPLADILRGRGRREKKGTGGDHLMFRVDRVVADPRRRRYTEIHYGMTKFIMGPASRSPTAMTLLVY